MLETIAFALLKGLSKLPPPVLRGLGRLVGFVFGHVIRHHRKHAFDALARSLPELSPKQRRRVVNLMYRLQGIHSLEMIRYSLLGPEAVREIIEFKGVERFERALAQGQGVLVLTAHVGNYELMPMATVSQGHRLTTIVKTIKNPFANRIIKRLRDHEDIVFLETKNAFRNCLRALKRNEIVGMVIDQNMTRKEGIFVDFFGRPACTSPGLAHLAAQSGAPVLPVFIYRRPDHRFTMDILPPLEPPSGRDAEAIREATQRYTRVIENAVRKAPEQWIWMHRRWRTRPTGSDGSKRAPKNRPEGPPRNRTDSP